MKNFSSVICIIICAIIMICLLIVCGIMASESDNNTSMVSDSSNTALDYNNSLEMENELLSDSSNVTLDYSDSSEFENALNSNQKVNGKTVKFYVNEYHPDSFWGINCWAGEHLNFISDNELDVKTGDYIIGRVKEEPAKFFDSWKIKYEIIEIQYSEKKDDEDTSTKNVENQTDNNDIVINNENVENIESNNTNPINEDKSNEEINQKTYNYYTTNDKKTAEEGATGKYAYVKKNNSYNIYWIIDFDEGYVYYFTEGNGEETCEKTKIKSGDLNNGVELSYKDSSNSWVKYMHFKYKNHPLKLIIIDNDYFDYEYSTTSLEDALKLMNSKTIWEP